MKFQLKGASFYPPYTCAAAGSKISIIAIGSEVLLTAKLQASHPTPYLVERRRSFRTVPPPFPPHLVGNRRWGVLISGKPTLRIRYFMFRLSDWVGYGLQCRCTLAEDGTRPSVGWCRIAALSCTMGLLRKRPSFNP